MITTILYIPPLSAPGAAIQQAAGAATAEKKNTTSQCVNAVGRVRLSSRTRAALCGARKDCSCY